MKTKYLIPSTVAVSYASQPVLGSTSSPSNLGGGGELPEEVNPD